MIRDVWSIDPGFGKTPDLVTVAMAVAKSRVAAITIAVGPPVAISRLRRTPKGPAKPAGRGGRNGS